ncbi:MAG: HEPN domain-containing protein, partial [Nanoarchaeota archaeon]
YKANNDLGAARLLLDNDAKYTDVICFHCQQGVEKYLKAYLIDQSVVFKRTHSLAYLLDLIADIENITEEMYQKADILESYAVEIRYPDDWYEPTKEEAQEAYEIALMFKKFVLDKVIY